MAGRQSKKTVPEREGDEHLTVELEVTKEGGKYTLPQSSIEKVMETIRSNRKGRTDREYASFLEGVIAAMLESSIEVIFDLVDKTKKFRGKKVSPENRELYARIEQIDKDRQTAGEDSNSKQSAKHAVKELYHTTVGWERHYRNYMQFKNRSVKRKTSKK